MTPYPFNPSVNAVFQFQPTLDNTVYNVSVTWNLFGERYYVNINTLQGILVVSLPLIGSPNNYDISLTAGYFTSTLVFREFSQQFEVSP
jgi:hypothetical protein